jgi:hypothetical protein
VRRLLVVLVVVAAVALTGCRLDVGVDVAVREDGSGIVAVTAEADAELLAQAPGALGDLRLDDVRAAGLDGGRTGRPWTGAASGWC